jgi:hypothetical protein
VLSSDKLVVGPRAPVHLRDPYAAETQARGEAGMSSGGG